MPIARGQRVHVVGDSVRRALVPWQLQRRRCGNVRGWCVISFVLVHGTMVGDTVHHAELLPCVPEWRHVRAGGFVDDVQLPKRL